MSIRNGAEKSDKKCLLSLGKIAQVGHLESQLLEAIGQLLLLTRGERCQGRADANPLRIVST